MFSVIIPLYNKEKDVAKTLESLLCQDFNEFEVIIINDGSTDGSVEVVKRYQDNRIEIYHTENRGLPAARNLGVHYAQYEYLTFLDADDLWQPNHLTTLKQLINTFPDQSWFATTYSTIIKGGTEFPSILYKKWPVGWQGLIDNFFLLNRTQWLTHICCICVKKSLFIKLGGFDEEMDYEEDIDFYIRLALQVPLAYKNTITLRYNTQGSNRISDSNFTGKKTLDWKKYKKEEAEREDLKKFMDFFRYTQCVKYKISSDYTKAKQARQGIHMSNITIPQRIAVFLPRQLLIWGMKLKDLLAQAGYDFHLTSADGK